MYEIEFTPEAIDDLKSFRKFEQQTIISGIDTQLKYQDVLGKFKENVSPYGLRVENVGDTYTAYWIVMWMVANQEAIPPVAKVKAAQKQIGETVLGSDIIAQSDDVKKQVVSEMLIYETMMALSMNNQIRQAGTPEQIKTLSDHAHKNMLKKGVDMRALELTTDGFVAKR